MAAAGADAAAIPSRRVPLRGYERMASMAPGVSRKIVHVLLVRGPPIALFLPAAVMYTFNKHPRMRALQLRDEFATAEIHSPVTLDDVHAKQLLRLADTPNDTTWQQYADHEINIPFDRFTEFPFFLTAWSNEAQSETRLMLFSDHYMSDGFSGLIVLNDVLEQVALLAQRSELALPEELPLRPSLYNLWLDSLTLTRSIMQLLIGFFGKSIYNRDVKRFTPLLPARNDQQDLRIPIANNSTRAVFGDGSVENAKKILTRCKAAGVTYTSAALAAVLLAYYHTAKTHGASVDDSSFKLSMGVDCNMRKRVPEPVSEDQVGHYVASPALSRFAKEGVDLTTARFWDVARLMKSDVHGAFDSTWSLCTSPIFCDQFMHSGVAPDELGFDVPASITDDTCVSSIGRFPFAKTHRLNANETLTVESLHFCNAMPSLSPGAGVYISSVDNFSYAIAHKYETEVGATLCRSLVAFCEHIASVDEHDTMLDVARQVGIQLE